MSYFASRSVSLGTPDANVIQATFYHFSPELIARAIPDAWRLANIEDILSTRLQIAQQLLTSAQAIPSYPGVKNQLSDLVQLAKSLPRYGRVLYSSLVNLDWTASPEIMAFGAATLLREHRGDTHNAILLSHSISGIQSNILQIADGRVSFNLLDSSRGWNEEQWRVGISQLIERDILTKDSTIEKPHFSKVGRQLKWEIESATDVNSDPWGDLEPKALHQFSELLGSISESVKTFIGFPRENPTGV